MVIAGAGGLVGGELLRLLATHPAVVSLRALSVSAAGRSWSEVHPALLHGPAGVLEGVGVGEAATDADAVLLALPHGRSREVVAELPGGDDGPLLVDLSADHRIHDERRHQRYYGVAGTGGAGRGFVYALADVLGDRLGGSRRLAVPGCFATAVLLALYPFASAGVVAGPPTAFAVTGSSGAGATPRRTTHHPVRAHSFFAYAVDGHRHQGEIDEQVVGWGGERLDGCRLLVHAAPLVRGIYATVHLLCSPALAEPSAILTAAYAGRPFVRVLAAPPELPAVLGTNYAHLHAAARGGGGEVVVTVAIDNLVKGAAGQAVQAMNLALGLDEAAGLGWGGLFPC